MKEWEKELYMYRLSPAPPKVKDLQEYIDLYLSEKDEKYFEIAKQRIEKAVKI